MHLGHYIGKNFNQRNISQGVSNLIIRTNTMLSKFNFCTSLVKSALFKTYCTSYYGCVLWSLRSRDIDRIYVTWRKIIRRLWNVPYRTHGRLLPVLLDDYSIEVQFMLRFSNFILKASQSDNSHISMCANLAYFSDTPVAGNMRVLAQVLNTDSVINIKIKHVKNRIVHMHHNVLSEDVKYTASYIKELCYIRDGSHTCDILSDTDVKSIIDILCCT